MRESMGLSLHFGKHLAKIFNSQKIGCAVCLCTNKARAADRYEESMAAKPNPVEATVRAFA